MNNVENKNNEANGIDILVSLREEWSAKLCRCIVLTGKGITLCHERHAIIIARETKSASRFCRFTSLSDSSHSRLLMKLRNRTLDIIMVTQVLIMIHSCVITSNYFAGRTFLRKCHWHKHWIMHVSFYEHTTFVEHFPYMISTYRSITKITNKFQTKRITFLLLFSHDEIQSTVFDSCQLIYWCENVMSLWWDHAINNSEDPEKDLLENISFCRWCFFHVNFGNTLFFLATCTSFEVFVWKPFHQTHVYMSLSWRCRDIKCCRVLECLLRDFRDLTTQRPAVASSSSSYLIIITSRR